MVKSSLTMLEVLAHESNYSKGRAGKRVCKISPHIMAGRLTAEQCGRHVFQNPARNASSNYGIGYAGDLAIYVSEEDRSWCSSSASNDNQAITIEISNSSTGGDWPISDASWNTLVELCVDICRRYDFRLTFDGTPNASLTYHQMFANKTCPGDYLKRKMNELCDIVNSRLDNNEQKQPEIIVDTTDYSKHKVGDVVIINGIYKASNSTQKLHPARNSGTITRIVNGARNPYLLDNGNLGWIGEDCIEGSTPVATPEPPANNKKSNEEVAREVIAGKYGTGNDRKNKLSAEGYDPATVQSIVNAILKGTPVQSNRKSNEEIAREVIDGKWDRGQTRKDKLAAAGYNYRDIQNLVNKMLK